MAAFSNSSTPLTYDLSFRELLNLIQSWGIEDYRATQIWKGLYQNYWNSPNQFKILPSELRDLLNYKLKFNNLELVKQVRSNDGYTFKNLFHLPDGNAIESVLMLYKRRRTICISTQSGCGMGCVFCATGRMGFRRNLSAGEIIEQVIFSTIELKRNNLSLTNIVLMGMGEPFQNYDAVLEAITRLNDSEGFNFGERRFTISTVGLSPAIRKFADEKRQINLAISLHAAENDLRSKLIPVNHKYPLEDLIDACNYYVAKTRRRISFEWALIEDMNDDFYQARKLAELLKGLLCHVNVIPLNPINGFVGRSASNKKAKLFQNELVRLGIPCTIRLGRGIDVGAGCGQLAIKKDMMNNNLK